jgi:hypothetical protein
LKKKYLSILIATVVLAVVAVAGYLKPVPAKETPVRVSLENKGGLVVFSHLAHSEDYGVECADCHHDQAEQSSQLTAESPGEPVPCGSCHAVAFGEEFRKSHPTDFTDKSSCQSCHHKEFAGTSFDHDTHSEEYSADCTDCHHTEDIEPDPGNCADCHEKEGDESMPSLRDAAHTRCASCHEEWKDEKLAGCENCHESAEKVQEPYTSCADCHEKPVKEMLLTRMNAYHQQCMGCHEEMGAGPQGEEDCNQCHRQ